MRYFTILVLIFTFAFCGKFAIAQSIEDLLLPEINISIAPENPTPNSVVSISINSYATDLNSANITWTVNGRVEKKGIAEKDLNVTVGGSSSVTTVEIGVRTRNGEFVEKSISIKPSLVDLYWQIDSFTPPFYKGKALFSHQNSLTVVALPQITNSNGAEINPKNLTYLWKKNGVVMQNQSGYGKNAYSFISPLISRPFQVSVDVTSPDSQSVGYASINLTPQEPDVVFYEKKSLLGIQFQKALSADTQLLLPEINVVAMPYYFDKNSRTRELVYRWSINGTFISNDLDSYSQIFRVQNQNTGKSLISISVEHPNKILQFTKKSFNLWFENEPTEESSF